MNHDEHPNDSALAEQLRDSLAELAAPGRPPLAAIAARGRTHKRRRFAGFAGITAAMSAAAVVLSLGLTGVFGSAPAHGTGTIRTTAFTLTMNTNGTATLTLNANVLLEPSILQSDLQQDGIPALVTTGSFCSSDPTPAGFNQVTGAPKPLPGTPLTFTINPAAMPAGTELSFGFFQLASVQGTGHPGQETVASLIDTNSYTCASTPPASGYGVSVARMPGGPK
jgi:hypothetical protein